VLLYIGNDSLDGIVILAIVTFNRLCILTSYIHAASVISLSGNLYCDFEAVRLSVTV